MVNSPLFKLAMFGLLALAASLPVYRICRHIHTPSQEPPAWPNSALSDFHNAVYFPGKAFLNRDNPYAAEYAREYPVNYELPPYWPGSLWFDAVWGGMPLRVAQAAYYAAMVASVIAFAAVGVRASRLPPTPAVIAGVAALVLLFRPAHSSLYLGQITPLVALGGALALDRCRSPLTSGLALAVAIFKPTFGIPIFLGVAAQRRWKTCLIGGSAAGLLAAAAILVITPDGDFVETLGSVVHSGDVNLEKGSIQYNKAWWRVDFPSVFIRSFGWRPSAKEEFAALALLLAPVLFLVARKPPEPASTEPGAGDDSPAIAAICAGTLFCAFHYAYDLMFLSYLLPMLAMPRRGSAWSRLPAARVTLLVLVLVLHTNFITGWLVEEFLQPQGLVRDIVLARYQIAVVALFVASCVALVLWGKKPPPQEQAE